MKMNRFSIKTAALAGLASLFLTASATPADACGGKKKEAQTAGAPKAVPADAATVSMRVDGMHCSGCSDKIKAVLAQLDGVHDVSVVDKRVTVKYDAKKVSIAALQKAISDLGYKAAAEA